jgi:hypothetical protein
MNRLLHYSKLYSKIPFLRVTPNRMEWYKGIWYKNNSTFIIRNSEPGIFSDENEITPPGTCSGTGDRGETEVNQRGNRANPEGRQSKEGDRRSFFDQSPGNSGSFVKNRLVQGRQDARKAKKL